MAGNSHQIVGVESSRTWLETSFEGCRYLLTRILVVPASSDMSLDDTMLVRVAANAALRWAVAGSSFALAEQRYAARRIHHAVGALSALDNARHWGLYCVGPIPSCRMLRAVLDSMGQPGFQTHYRLSSAMRAVLLRSSILWDLSSSVAGGMRTVWRLSCMGRKARRHRT